ncbi:hypothetical protein XA68_12605 [Ophiocordyceps unilateralis]|uniref:Uncharacterized protein n=1 Tax=Ophiocordyceps unilateralis TaxID=268505 RepID=A0A2A9PCM8_OPHUN|nr:hypothetical protein XA68_12605 [Ophiocordyceps unilateralis]
METHHYSDEEMPSSPPAAASTQHAHGFLSPTRSPMSFSTRSPLRLPSRSPPRSPPRSPSRSTRMKEKRVPSVTPRRLRTFFTPRTHLSTISRMTLGTLDSASVNRLASRPLSPPPSSDPIEPPSSPTERLQAVENANRKKRSVPQSGSRTKRRRTVLSDEEPQSTVADEKKFVSVNGVNERRTLSQFFKASRRGVMGSGGKSLQCSPPILAAQADSSTSLRGYRPQPIRKLRNRGFEASLLDREHGFSTHTGKQYLAFPTSDPRIETANFYSDSSDAYHCTPLGNQPGTSIPFSLASCHRASLTAIGDERGHVRYFSTAGDASQMVTSWVKVHDNAIMDLDFSADDTRLASACGDRTGRVLDTQTQSVAVELGEHWDSLRQVTFQPGSGNGNVLASSDRAGRVQVWDLRCSSLPAQCFSSAADGVGRDRRLDIVAARTVNTIDSAHERTMQGSTSSSSVTALQWLPAGREHLLLTGSEANGSVKLWDTRYIKARRQRQAAETPIAVTPEPATHAWRSYGITSMTLGTDAARLYVVCKDSTVYAYSTNHLVLGHAPELLDGASKRKPLGSQGLGPLYGLKNDKLRVGSFYVKCAVRPGGGGGADELLAVGSSDGCAVVFPTNERYMRAAWARREHIPAGGTTSMAPPPTPSNPWASTTLPLVRAGTPLVRGHSLEVTTLSWSWDGKLVTASDDCFVRRWQRNAARAGYLRQVGEFGGERHLAGWAEVGDDWDVDEC